MNRLEWLLVVVGKAHNHAVMDALSGEEILLQDAVDGNFEYWEWICINPPFCELLRDPLGGLQ